MTKDEALKQALEALTNELACGRANDAEDDAAAEQMYDAITAIKEALLQPLQEPVAWTERELELLDGMIGVQLDHANRCDSIANRTMADKQKGWDMERVALLQKIKATPPAAQPEERNFCPRCGKRTNDIHTCTPPQEKNHG